MKANTQPPQLMHHILIQRQYVYREDQNQWDFKLVDINLFGIFNTCEINLRNNIRTVEDKSYIEIYTFLLKKHIIIMNATRFPHGTPSRAESDKIEWKTCQL